MMRYILLAIIFREARAACDCSDLYNTTHSQTSETLGWLNGLISSWYEINNHNLFDLVSEIVRNETADVLPVGVNSVELTKLHLTATPTVTAIKSQHVKVKCDDASFTRYVMDLDIKMDAPNSVLAEARVKFLLGVSARVSVEDFFLSGHVRVEVLMNNRLPFPGVQNLKMTFISRPVIDFDVEVFDLVGLDTFGIADWVHSMIEDEIQNRLVYPGLLFVDLTAAAIAPVLINNDSTLHPAVVSASITVTPINITSPKSTLEAQFDYNDGGTKKFEFGNEGHHQFDVFFTNFEHQLVRARVIERNMIKFDETWADFRVNVPRHLRSESLVKSYNKVHTEGGSSWNITMSMASYFLPPVRLLPTDDGSLALMPTLFSQANCSESNDYGVLYIHIHRGLNFSSHDEIDPFIKLTMDTRNILTTDTKYSTFNPVFDEKIEVLIRRRGSPVSEHVLEFEAFDWDRFSSNDLVGSVRVIPEKENLVNEPIQLYKNGLATGTLYVSVIFRPVPFF